MLAVAALTGPAQSALAGDPVLWFGPCTQDDDCEDRNECTLNLCHADGSCRNPTNPDCCLSDFDCYSPDPCFLPRCYRPNPPDPGTCEYAPYLIYPGCCDVDAPGGGLEGCDPASDACFTGACVTGEPDGIEAPIEGGGSVWLPQCEREPACCNGLGQCEWLMAAADRVYVSCQNNVCVANETVCPTGCVGQPDILLASLWDGAGWLVDCADSAPEDCWWLLRYCRDNPALCCPTAGCGTGECCLSDADCDDGDLDTVDSCDLGSPCEVKRAGGTPQDIGAGTCLHEAPPPGTAYCETPADCCALDGLAAGECCHREEWSNEFVCYQAPEPGQSESCQRYVCPGAGICDTVAEGCCTTDDDCFHSGSCHTTGECIEGKCHYKVDYFDVNDGGCKSVCFQEHKPLVNENPGPQVSCQSPTCIDFHQMVWSLEICLLDCEGFQPCCLTDDDCGNLEMVDSALRSMPPSWIAAQLPQGADVKLVAERCLSSDGQLSTCSYPFKMDCDGDTDCADPLVDPPCTCEDPANDLFEHCYANCVTGPTCRTTTQDFDDYCIPGGVQPEFQLCNSGTDPCVVADGQCDSLGRCVSTECQACDDGNMCTDDWCDPALGCQYFDNNLPCNDDNECTLADVCSGGACAGPTPLDCDDGNPCTDDSCDPGSGCIYDPAGGPCDDGDACTVGDSCVTGQCQSGSGSPDCDDGDPCTTDSCEPTSGCLNPANDCDDGDACTDDYCQVGTGQCDHYGISCDDEDPCTNDTCDPAAGCVHQQLAEGEACDDGNSCTDGDACDQLGACAPGPPTDCNDGNICTDDSCDSGIGCQHTDNQLPCNDGDACTTGDVCVAGQCSGTPAICDDGVACTNDSCDAQTGECQFLAADIECDDGEQCTDDKCDPAAGDPVSGCAFSSNTVVCDDGNQCTGTEAQPDQCSEGACVPGGFPCGDGNECTFDVCDAQLGCDNVPAADGTSCTYVDNGQPECWQAECNQGTCQRNLPLFGDDSKCPDSDQCIDSYCETLQGDPSYGKCAEDLTAKSGNTCDDGDACTKLDKCASGQCLSIWPTDCDDTNVCTDDSCVPASGCVNEANTAGCDDDSLCTVGDQCAGGTCVSDPLDCNDGNPCTEDSCDPAIGCQYANIAGLCDDGDACTADDACENGVCLGGPAVQCNDGDACTDDWCTPSIGCMHAAVNCDDGEICTDLTCDVVAGCLYLPVTCDDENACTEDSCVPGAGCEYIPVSAPCSDDNTCTDGDVCADGICISGNLITCDDDNMCTDDSCNPVAGCQYTANAIPCNDDDACTLEDACGDGFCQGPISLPCNDDNVCTDDDCDPDTGCVNAPNAEPCNDGVTCTVGDVCDAAQCAGTPDDGQCDDFNTCTTDTCHPVQDCQNAPLPQGTACDDGNPCTLGDNCSLDGRCEMDSLLTKGVLPADCADPGLTEDELLQCACYPVDFEVSGTDARWPRIAAIEHVPFAPFAVAWEERSGDSSLVRLTVFYQKTVAGPANPHLLKSVDVVVDQSSDSARGVHTPDVAVTYASAGNPPVQVLYLVVSWIRETTAADGGDYLKNVRMQAYRLDLDVAEDVPFSLVPVGGEVKLISDAVRVHHPDSDPTTARWGPAVAGFPTDAGMGAGCMVGILQWDGADDYWPTWAYYAVDDFGLSELADRWYAEISAGDVQPTPDALFLGELKPQTVDQSLKIDVAVTHHDDPAWDGVGFLAWPRNAGNATFIHLLAEKLAKDGDSLTFDGLDPESTILRDEACRSDNDFERAPDLLPVPLGFSDIPRVFLAYTAYMGHPDDCPVEPGHPVLENTTGLFGQFVALESDSLAVSYLEGISEDAGLETGANMGPSSALGPGNRLAVSWNYSWGSMAGIDVNGVVGILEDAGPLWTVNFASPPGSKLFGDGTKDDTKDSDPVLAFITDSRFPIVYAWGADPDTPHTIRLDVEP